MNRRKKLNWKLATLGFYGGSVLGVGGCLPDNYVGTLFTRLTTNAADFAALSLLDFALQTVLPQAVTTTNGEQDSAAEVEAM